MRPGTDHRQTQAKESPGSHTPAHLTGAQIGAICEALVPSQLMLASDGRLTPFYKGDFSVDLAGLLPID